MILLLNISNIFVILGLVLYFTEIMANIKSAKKDIRKTARRTSRNKKLYSELDKAIKKVKSKSEGGLNQVYSILDKMSSRGVIKKNAAARKKSRIAAKTK